MVVAMITNVGNSGNGKWGQWSVAMTTNVGGDNSDGDGEQGWVAMETNK